MDACYRTPAGLKSIARRAIHDTLQPNRVAVKMRSVLVLLVTFQVAPCAGGRSICKTGHQNSCGNQSCYDWFTSAEEGLAALTCSELSAWVGCDCDGCCHTTLDWAAGKSIPRPPPPPLTPSFDSCPLGYELFADRECVACAAGQYGHEDETGLSTCSLADSKHYVPEPNSTKGEECPNRTHVATTYQVSWPIVQPWSPEIQSGQGATSMAECRCERESYKHVSAVYGSGCLPCPSGATCLGDTFQPYASPGYGMLRLPDEDELPVFLKCEDPRSCPGGQLEPSSTLFGSTGPFCDYEPSSDISPPAPLQPPPAPPPLMATCECHCCFNDFNEGPGFNESGYPYETFCANPKNTRVRSFPVEANTGLRGVQLCSVPQCGSRYSQCPDYGTHNQGPGVNVESFYIQSEEVVDTFNCTVANCDCDCLDESEASVLLHVESDACAAEPRAAIRLY